MELGQQGVGTATKARAGPEDTLSFSVASPMELCAWLPVNRSVSHLTAFLVSFLLGGPRHTPQLIRP